MSGICIPDLAKSLEDYKDENEGTIEATMGSLMENFTEVVAGGGMGVDLEDVYQMIDSYDLDGFTWSMDLFE